MKWKNGEKIDLDNRHLTTEHEDDTHLKEDTEGVTDVVRIEFLQALSAIPALKEKRVSHRSLTQFLLQIPGLTGGHNRGKRRKGFENLIQFIRIRVLRKLKRLLHPPTINFPARRYRRHVGLAQFRTTTDLLGDPKMQGLTLTLIVIRDAEDEARAIVCFLLLSKR